MDIPRHSTDDVLDPLNIEVISFEELYSQKIAQDTIYDHHRVSFYQIFRYKGRGNSHFVKNVKITMEDDSLLIVNQDILQRFSTQDCTGDMILFSVDFFGNTREKVDFLNQSLLFQSDYAIIHPRSIKFVKQVEFYFSLMKIQTDKGQETKLALLRNCLHNLLLIIEREYRIQKKRFDSVENQSYIQQFRVLLDQHYLTEKRVYFYAEKLNMSEKKLTRIVSSVHGVSAKEYIREKVLSEAIRLLKNTTFNQGEIAGLLGLDFTYFIKFFRKHIGMSPAKYRKKLGLMIE